MSAPVHPLLNTSLNSLNAMLAKNGRGRTPEEKPTRKQVFWEGLDYYPIRIYDNPWPTRLNKGRSFVVGENIFLAGKAKGSLRVLIHEAAHVWQFQCLLGWAYLLRALPEQADYALGRCNPYDYAPVENHLPFSAWGIEQQAQWIEEHRRLPGESFRR